MMRATAQRMLGVLDRCFAFHSPAHIARASFAVMLLGGLVALLLGQDANWDLRNYHLYNGYAALQGRWAQDLAPAHMQSYFSPLLDMLHYLLMVRLPAPLGGFLLGAFHGLVFLPLAGIALHALGEREQRARLAPLLALAGMCTSAFLSELGGSMADNTSAVFVIGAVYLVLQAHSRQRAGNHIGLGCWVLAGLLLGTAVAFKLTNAVYAIALGLAAVAGGGVWRHRVAGLALLTASALLAAALLAGWWYWQVWVQFGNPLFPQFNAYFQAPLAAPIAVADTRWLPSNLLQHLAWPLLFSLDPGRVSEVKMLQVLWPLLYLGGLVLLLSRLFGVRRERPRPSRAVLALLVFFCVGYVLWQGMFSIYRYLVVLELIAPLLLWLLVERLLPAARAARWAGRVVAVCVAISLLGANGWGHEAWAREGFRVQAPTMDAPGQSVVLLVGGEPQAWRVPFLPAAARYVGVAGTFPESEGYRQAVATIVQSRKHHYAMLPAPQDKQTARLGRINGWAAALGLNRDGGCQRLEWLARRVRGLRAVVAHDQGSDRCQLVPRDATTQDAARLHERRIAGDGLARYGLALDEQSCVQLSSWIGQGEYPWQWCRVVAMPAAGAGSGNAEAGLAQQP